MEHQEDFSHQKKAVLRWSGPFQNSDFASKKITAKYYHKGAADSWVDTSLVDAEVA